MTIETFFCEARTFFSEKMFEMIQKAFLVGYYFIVLLFFRFSGIISSKLF